MKLEDMEIQWLPHPTNIKYFYTELENELILLRVNNYPEEELLTVIRGMEIYDVEAKPSSMVSYFALVQKPRSIKYAFFFFANVR